MHPRDVQCSLILRIVRGSRLDMPSCQNHVSRLFVPTIQSGGGHQAVKSPENVQPSDQRGKFCVGELCMVPGRLPRSVDRNKIVSGRPAVAFDRVLTAFSPCPGVVGVYPPLKQAMLATIEIFVSRNAFHVAFLHTESFPEKEKCVLLPFLGELQNI